MRHNYGLFISLLLCIACREERVGGAEEILSLNDGIFKVLFIGNSHTYYNDLPEIVKSVALQHNYADSILVRMVAPGGYSIADHLQLETKEKTIEAENWDVVVIQENATTASLPAESAEINMYQPAYQLARIIKDKNDQTRIVWFLTHAYRQGIIPCEADPEICSFDLMLSRIRRNYLSVSSQVVSEVAPAGVIWKILFSENELFGLHDGDDIHPNLLGSWVSAATIYTVVFEHALEESNFSLPMEFEEYKTMISDLINQAIFENNPDWRLF